jgi:transcriptional accessory protein Tex/SPT6
VGKIYEGTVLKLLDFGAIVNILPGKDGLLHISEIVNERVKDIKDWLKEGQQVRVKLIQADERVVCVCPEGCAGRRGRQHQPDRARRCTGRGTCRPGIARSAAVS